MRKIQKESLTHKRQRKKERIAEAMKETAGRQIRD